MSHSKTLYAQERSALFGAALLVLAGCVNSGGRETPASSSDGGAGAVRSEAETGPLMYIGLIRGMLAQGQYYAALAHIEERQRAGVRTPELRLLEAEARRELGQRAPAETIYRELLAGPFAADAYHGLGLLFGETNLTEAVRHLREAVRRRPTDARLRNDLGYALLLSGRDRDALPQFATAVELAPDVEKHRNNLLLLLLVTGDEAGARRSAAQSGMSAERLEGLRRQAQSLKARRTAGPNPK